MTHKEFKLIDGWLDSDLPDEGIVELKAWLQANPAHLEIFARASVLHRRLRDSLRAEAMTKEAGEDEGGRQALHFNSQIPSPSVSAPPLPSVIVSSLPHNSPLTLESFVDGPVFSYMVATVIVCVMLLSAWAYKITHFQPQVVEAPSQSVPSSDRLEMVFVGRITGMTKCKWSDPSTEPYADAYVPLGRKYALASGLMEITYDSGAKVILQGPCTYEVESRAGGYLSLGKLTAKVETRGEGRGARDEDVPHYPLFSVRTPTAVITDLGTEFGVEVSEDGNTMSHVFRGSVRVQVVSADFPSPAGRGAGDEDRAIQLIAGESARVERGTDRITVIHREAVLSELFTRRMPRRAPIKLFNTGKGLKEGNSEPRWQLVAVSNDPNFKPQPAVVISIMPTWYQRNDPTRSQWISTSGQSPDSGALYMPILPNNVTYTFRTTFDLTDATLDSAVLRGRFIADNRVSAIRLNDVALPVPEHGNVPPFYDFHPFVICKGFVEGTNVLEFDVFSGYPADEIRGFNFMALRVELNGFVVQVQRDPKAKMELNR